MKFRSPVVLAWPDTAMTRRAMIVVAASLLLAVAGSGYAFASHETGEVKSYTGSPTQAAAADAAFATTHWAENAFPRRRESEETGGYPR